MASKINHSAFDEISAEALYWAGFILADGSVRLEKRTFSTGTVKFYKSVTVALAARDAAQLGKLKLFLSSEHRVIKYVNRSTFGDYEQCRLAFLSPRIFDRLAFFGVIPHKTQGTQIPSEVGNSRDFWRGFVDGDGYITISRSGSQKVPYVGACGCREVMASFQAYLERLTGVKYAITPSKTAKCFAIKLNGRHALEVISVLYRDAKVALDRKLKIARQVLKTYD